jgi:hypothetical protein
MQAAMNQEIISASSLSAMWQEAQTHLLTLCRDGGAAERGWGSQSHATSIILVESSRLNPGEPARDDQESGKEAGETRTESSEALQAVKWGRGV